jgi:hypothetical protein
VHERPSPQDVLADPDLLSGLSPDAVDDMFGDVPGWRVEALRRGSHQGGGWVLREYGADGNLTGSLIRWHPGGGHHGPDPYWRVSSSRYGRSEEIR